MPEDKNIERPVSEKRISSNYNNRSKNRKKKKVRGTFFFLIRWLIFLLIGIAGVGIYLGLTHPIFNIQYITVSGAVKNSAEKIIETASFQKGDNLFRAKITESEEAINALPDIDNVRINRNIPNRIHITVDENYNFAYFDSKGKTYVINGDGDISPFTDQNREEIIKITGIMIEELNKTKALPKDSYIRDLNSSIVELNLYDYINEINLSNPANIIFTLKDSATVELGDTKNLMNKMGVLRKILEESYANNIPFEKIIINNNQSPIVLPKNTNDNSLNNNNNQNQQTENSSERVPKALP